MGRYLSTVADFKARTILQPEAVDRLIRMRWNRNLADPLPATVTPETKFGDIVDSGNVTSLTLVVSAAVASSGTDYATINVYKRTGGGPRTLIGSLSTVATSLPANIPIALTISAAAVTAEDILTVEIVKTGAGVVLPALYLDAKTSVNFVTRAIDRTEDMVDSRLSKRYTVPVDAGSPGIEAVRRWVTYLVTREVAGREGFNPASAQDEELVIKQAEKAEAELTEAANSETGLFELQLSNPPGPDPVTKGAPLGYAEQSPWVAFDAQLQEATFEDSISRGR